VIEVDPVFVEAEVLSELVTEGRRVFGGDSERDGRGHGGSERSWHCVNEACGGTVEEQLPTI
jgi:hypothetical protein